MSSDRSLILHLTGSSKEKRLKKLDEENINMFAGASAAKQTAREQFHHEMMAASADGAGTSHQLQVPQREGMMPYFSPTERGYDAILQSHRERVLSRLIVLQEIDMFCPFCAVQLGDAPKFCPSCGQNVEFLTQLPSVGHLANDPLMKALPFEV
ncbi:unnamed protein product [Boreogadus saida]